MGAADANSLRHDSNSYCYHSPLPRRATNQRMPADPNHRVLWPEGRALPASFFDRDARLLARELSAKVVRHQHGEHWLSVRIIETEAYYLNEKGNHASLGYTPKRRALFRDGGYTHMYSARGGSLSVCAHGPGSAPLIKSAYPRQDTHSAAGAVTQMQANNPIAQGRARAVQKRCSKQTLLCKTLGLKVPDWDAHPVDEQHLFVEDRGERPPQIVQCTRVGIPHGRGEQLPYGFVDAALARHCTRNPRRRGQRVDRDFYRLTPKDYPR
jgi:DNA-3-methyladenine glycosylase